MWVKAKKEPIIRLRVHPLMLQAVCIADYLLTEMLRTFCANPTCRHIIFGGCHDTGYLVNLEQFKHNESKAACITLLESKSLLDELRL